MKTFLLILSIFSFSYNILLCQSNLWINDPQRWYVGQGTIEEAELVVKPKGLYTECDMFLTISGRSLGLFHEDTLEIIYDFYLPENTIVHDSWLWFNGEIIKGDIMDRWTASQIYEEIVSRNQDPSILVKNHHNHYELRVFPMAGDESRKVKLTFLFPTHWSTLNVETIIPTNIIKSTKFPLKELKITTILTEEWENPRIEELPSMQFEKLNSSDYEDTLSVLLSEADLNSSINLTYVINAPLTNGTYLTTFEGAEENSYQLAYLPTIPTEDFESKKNVFLFDYETNRGNTTFAQVLSSVKSMLLENYSERDSFNLIFSNSTINRISKDWLPADSNTVASTFNEIDENIISNYSNLPSLLFNGIDFIANNNNEGEIVLIANTDKNGELNAANALIEDLLDSMEVNIPIFVGDYLEWTNNWYYYGNKDYRGTGYFYENITKLTGGSYYTVNYNNPFNSMIISLFNSLGPNLSTFDLHTTLEDGFCYSRFNLNGDASQISLNKPILQVGQYYGDLPFSIEFNGLIDGKPFHGTKSITQDEIVEGDSITDVIWSGKFIGTLEDDYDYFPYLSNQEIYDIIDLSIEKRILTKYTAFLCLEPGMNIDPLIDPRNDDGGGIVDVEEEESVETDTLFTSYPNPFNNQTTIKIRLSKNISSENVSFKIYNILGQVVKTFNNLLSTETNEFEFNWNGKNDNGEIVSSGNYFFVMNNGNKVKTLKLILMK